jgi:hypothetical protein
MNTVIIALLLLGVCLALIIGLMSALQKVKSNPLQEQADSLSRGPQFRDHSASDRNAGERSTGERSAGDHSAGNFSGDSHGSRSQFAWQSRSHSRAPD